MHYLDNITKIDHKFIKEFRISKTFKPSKGFLNHQNFQAYDIASNLEKHTLKAQWMHSAPYFYMKLKPPGRQSGCWCVEKTKAVGGYVSSSSLK